MFEIIVLLPVLLTILIAVFSAVFLCFSFISLNKQYKELLKNIQETRKLFEKNKGN